MCYRIHLVQKFARAHFLVQCLDVEQLDHTQRRAHDNNSTTYAFNPNNPHALIMPLKIHKTQKNPLWQNTSEGKVHWKRSLYFETEGKLQYGCLMRRLNCQIPNIYLFTSVLLP